VAKGTANVRRLLNSDKTHRDFSRKAFYTAAARRRQTYEVHTDGRNVRLGVGIVSESKQQTRLSYTGISNQEKLEEIVAVH
jgi:hypothetical protein